MHKVTVATFMVIVLGGLTAPTLAEPQAGNQGGDQGADSGDNITFERLDQNDDGVLDEHELSAFGAPAAGDEGSQNPHVDAHERDRGERVLNLYDKDGDGEVTPEEFKKDKPTEEVW
ncbi:EF-hand domain-containing protein [Marinobacter salicampi]|uniref:EF-hand domain-containing protein n=1 Tax=Marinobacter salicampi TaxID=435907 RepID=UPI00140A6497|nr:EF-hand domain-containing protein [Marinobacter salicampi]